MVSSRRYTPRRGDVVWLSFQPQAGHEQTGRRPVLVLSPEPYNARVGLALCCPITGRVKSYPFEVTTPPGRPVAGVVLADQVRSLDWRARRAEFICRLPRAQVEETLAKLQVLLGTGEA